MSSLYLLESSRRLKTILLTSTQPEEGKTTLTINLALTMMLSGKKVLILDADFRKPTIHKMLGLVNTRGFADVVTGILEVQDIIEVEQVLEVTDPLEHKQRLSVITAGNASPNSLKPLGSPKVREAIEYLTTVYDVALLDSPPVLSVSDPLLLAPMVDGVLLVLNTGIVTERDSKIAKARLEQAGGRILGVAMNRFDETLHGPGFHPHRNYYM